MRKMKNYKKFKIIQKNYTKLFCKAYKNLKIFKKNFFQHLKSQNLNRCSVFKNKKKNNKKVTKYNLF